MYPEVSIVVVKGQVLYDLTLQRLNEWKSMISSEALSNVKAYLEIDEADDVDEAEGRWCFESAAKYVEWVLHSEDGKNAPMYWARWNDGVGKEVSGTEVPPSAGFIPVGITKDVQVSGMEVPPSAGLIPAGVPGEYPNRYSQLLVPLQAVIRNPENLRELRPEPPEPPELPETRAQDRRARSQVTEIQAQDRAHGSGQRWGLGVETEACSGLGHFVQLSFERASIGIQYVAVHVVQLLLGGDHGSVGVP
ncbi:hypothetical protein OF83DRAFT_1089196 [Amylostereum chailletii]|nr:hypothetical protein OF83DRAFT_1089196 [Amylostereum chailletii]